MLLIEVAQALSAKNIPYAIVGGVATALHGAVRGTVDIDLILDISEENFISAEAVFHSLGLQPRLPVKAQEIYRFRKEWIKNRNLIAWSFFDPRNLTRQVDVVITTDLTKKKTKIVKVQGISVRILAKKDLVEMKKLSGRPQDLEDIKALEAMDE